MKSLPALSRPAKRKRSSASSQDLPKLPAGRLPPDSINPFSYSPSTLTQFSVAGLLDTDEDPAQTIPNFPHRDVSRSTAAADAQSSADEDGAEEVSEDKAMDAKARRGRAHDIEPGSHLDVLLNSVHLFLSEGDVAKAARAYGLILGLRTHHGLPLDIRRHNLWAIGAEILMRRGEMPANISKPSSDQEEHQDPSVRLPTRWGLAANMGNVKTYYETLIQQHPYDYKHPRLASAPDFWLAMLGCEVYNAHAEHTIAFSRLEADQAGGEDRVDSGDLSDEDDEELKGLQSARPRGRKDKIRLQALTTMKDITRRMDHLMQEPPYSKDRRFLRLRAMASLYEADLLVPTRYASPLQLQEAQRARETEQEIARASLQKIVDNGGRLDEPCRAFLDPDGEDEEQKTFPLYSSLPIRKVL